MNRLQRSMNHYVKTLSDRTQNEEREKLLPVVYVGSTMSNHGQDFAPDSEFGSCLSRM